MSRKAEKTPYRVIIKFLLGMIIIKDNNINQGMAWISKFTRIR